MDKKIRWGIMGTGFIAERFSAALNALEDAEILAVGSRAQESADAFAARVGAPRAYGSYEDLVSDPDVDVVYIATPHRFHSDNALLCIEHGKAVLCEKAFTVNAKEAREVARAAREKNVFVMEAFWPRFQPLNREIRRLVCEEKAIGDVRMMDVQFVKIENWPDDHRLYNPNLAGGSLLDLGIYTLSYTAFFLGSDPTEVHSVGTFGKGGVDDQCSILMKYKSGAISRQAAALQTRGDVKAVLYGTRGRVDIPDFFRVKSCDITLYDTGGTRRLNAEPFLCNGYEYEAQEVMDCLRAGKTQSDTMSLEESVRLMEILDGCRKDWGYVYPFEV